MSEPLYLPAELWEPGTDKSARCRLCAQYCLIAEGASGKCGVRKNRSGSLLTRAANEVAAVNLDPVEKKPLYHFLPGTQTFSVGGFGCNFSCDFCQNSDISQYHLRWESGGNFMNPARVVSAAQKYRAASVSYTYNEPTVFFELMRPSAALAHEHGLYNIMVSNAYMSPEAFKRLDGLVDAANFDLKSFSDGFYRDYCGARLKPVLQTIARAVKAGWWVEVTTLLIAGLNDGGKELDSLASYIYNELGPDVPWHVSRFRPAFRMLNRPVTPLESIERAMEAGLRAGLNYVYAGNIPGHEAESTFCPSCKARLIGRVGYNIQVGFSGVCPDCGFEISGFWK